MNLETGNVQLKDIVMWLLGALLSIIMLISGFTLNSIDKKMGALSDIISDHSSRLSRVEAVQLYDSGRISGIEDREREAWMAKYKPAPVSLPKSQ